MPYEQSAVTMSPNSETPVLKPFAMTWVLRTSFRVQFFKRFIQLASGTLIWSFRTKGHHQTVGSRRRRRKLQRPSRRLPLRHPALSLVRSLASIGLLALVRVEVLHPPLVAMKVRVQVVGVMSK
jgi:hypothetical protein